MKRSFEGSETEIVNTEAAHRKAAELLSKYAIRMEDFLDLYDPKSVQRDIQYVQKMEKKFQSDDDPTHRENVAHGEILEGIVYDQGEMNEWFGSHAFTIRPSRYDDIENGVDLVVEFRQEGRQPSHLALAVDVTFGGYEIAEKMRRIKEEITAGDLTRIKYFQSSNKDFRGEKSMVPRIVAGIEKRAVRDLAGLWLAGKQKELAEHPAQFAILEEAELQLATYAEFARGIGNTRVADAFEQELAVVRSILHEPEKAKLRARRWEDIRSLTYDDGVFRSIKGNTELFHQL